MKIRRCKIRVLSNATPKEAFDDFTSRFKEVWKAAEADRLVSSEHDFVITLPDASWLAKIFSPERVRLIQAVKYSKPASIMELARILGREKTNVHKDVTVLADLGILELKKIKAKGEPEVVRPEFRWDEFDIAV